MIKSMTGFGQAAGGRASARWAVEIRSWNHRFFEFSARLPAALSALEEKIRDRIRTQIKRGKITMAVAMRTKDAGLDQPTLDEKRVDFYVRAIRKIQKRYHLSDSLSVNTLFSIPNLFSVDRKDAAGEESWPALSLVIDRAVAKLIASKAKEGGALAHDLRKRATVIKGSLKRIEALAQKWPHARRDRIEKRVRELTSSLGLDSERLEREVAILAERSDVTEEIVRFKHHLDTFQKSLVSDREVGKKLDFIAQEMHREVNTIASKSQQSEIAHEVIRIKSEVEKMREQIQNIE